ncbi:MAG TPA: peptidoglycan-associated lipoprotein Pal [Candidatus Krumholzibacteriaceae bacterium]
MSRYKWLILALAIAIVLSPACAKKHVTPLEKPVEQTSPPVIPPPIEQQQGENPPVIQEKPVEIALGDAFFDLEKYVIDDEYRSVLTKNAELLMANPSRKLLVEGHCDERGTIEYNMALGEKRAKAVIDFYTTYGVKPDRLTMISYGKERPFDPGHDEAAWAKNRRAHMVLQ